jgi:hypothetical protein
MYERFVIALDGRLITVPFIDFRAYPAGLRGDTSKNAGDFTREQARALAVIPCFGPLPVALAVR